MNIWIVAKKAHFDSYGNRRLREQAEVMGINLQMIAPEEVDIVVSKDDKSSVHIEGKKITTLPDGIIPRMGAGTTYQGLALIRQLERLGIYSMNSSESIEIARDKLATMQLLASNNIAIPKTMLAKRPIDPNEIGREFDFPVLIKKITGSQGRGIVLCQTKTQLRDTIDMADDNRHIIIQEFIKSSRGKDIRVFIVGGKAIGAMMRKAPRGSVKANASRGGKTEFLALNPELEWLALESARLVGLEMAGVDLLFDKDGYCICEVNSSPGFEGFEAATKINVPEAILSFMQVRLHHQV